MIAFFAIPDYTYGMWGYIITALIAFVVGIAAGMKMMNYGE
jgi:hypothetical protein